MAAAQPAQVLPGMAHILIDLCPTLRNFTAKLTVHDAPAFHIRFLRDKRQAAAHTCTISQVASL
jgi:hypothetical protein